MSTQQDDKSLKRDFKGVWIPREIYLNQDLSWMEKILLVEIDSLSQKERGCFASNSYFAGFLGVSMGQITDSLTKMRKLGLVEDVGFDGRNRFLRSTLHQLNPEADYGKTRKQGTEKSVGRVRKNNPAIYKSNNTDNKTEIVSPASPEGGSEPDGQNLPQPEDLIPPQLPPSPRRTIIGMTPGSDAPDEAATTRKAKPKLDGVEELAVLGMYKTQVYGLVTPTTQTAVEGIKRAIGIFSQQFGKDGIPKLLEALHALPGAQAFQWRIEKDPTAAAPKTVFSQQFIENYLLPLVSVSKEKYEHGSRDVVKRATTEEERREVSAINKANRERFMARSKRGEAE